MVGGGTALFSSEGSSRGFRQSSNALCEFKAGKMTLNGTTVTADKRRGMIQIEHGDDQLMHFKWKDRGTGKVEDDLLIFPDDIEFKKVPQCTTGRVYLLKFKSSSKKMFFWMQEPKTDKDESYCKQVNSLLNHPPPPGGNRSSGSGGNSDLGSGLANLDLGNLRNSELETLLGSMNQQQLMQFLGGSGSGGLGNLASLLGGAGGGSGSPLLSSRQRSSGGSRSSSERSSRAPATTSSSSAAVATTTASTPSTTAPSTTASSAGKSKSGTTSGSTSSATAGAAAPIQLSDLQNILSGIKVPGSSGEGQSEAQGQGPNVDLASGLTAELVKPLLSKPDFVKRMKELLPADHKDKDSIENEIKGTIQTPQFQQALSLFSSAFQSAQLAPLIREFNLGDEAVAAATAGNMEAFVKVLQKAEEKSKQDEPEDMALD